MLHDLWYQLRTALRRRAVEDDLDDEVRFHLDRETAKHVAQGVPPAEARRRARLTFGQLDVVKDDCRQAWGLRLFDELTRDLRLTVRGLWRKPLFTVVTLATLTLGLGAFAVVYTTVDKVLIEPLPYERPDDLYYVWRDYSSRGGSARSTAAASDLADLRAAGGVFGA